jgi:pimeloyl-ACP methyl ester carboxylesterase
MDFKCGMVRSGSTDIYYELHYEGNAEDNAEYLVLLHGNAENMRRMQAQIDFFSKCYKVLAIDSRGHGQSGFGQGELNLTTMAIDVENVLYALGIDRVNILGFSDGANIAMLFAIKNPDMVDRLVLVSGNLKPNGMQFGPLAAVVAAYYLSKLAGRFDPKFRLEHEYYYLMAKEPNITPAMLARITAKTLVIAGDKDLIKSEHTHQITQGIKNAKELILPGDHFIIYRTPEVINEAAERFLKDD